MPRIAFIGAGQRRLHEEPARRHPLVPGARGTSRSRSTTSTPDRLDDGRGDGARTSPRERGATPAITVPPRPARRARRAPTTCSTWCRSAATRRRCSTSRSRRATGCGRRSRTRSGSAGIFRTLRTADHMLALGREMAELCPSAWLLNYTNPMAMLCWLVYGGTPTHERRRPLPLGAVHDRGPGRARRRARRGGHVPRRRAQPPGVHPPLRARRRGPLPAPRRAHRVRPRAPAARARRSSTGGSATSRPSRASTPPSTCRGSCGTTTEIERYRIPVDEYIRRSEENLVEYERVKGRARPRRGDAARALERVRRVDHPLDGDGASRA